MTDSDTGADTGATPPEDTGATPAEGGTPAPASPSPEAPSPTPAEPTADESADDAADDATPNTGDGGGPRPIGGGMLTLTEASAVTGLTRKSLARRVERGTIPSRKIDMEGKGEVIVIARASLEALGLLGKDGSPGPEATKAAAASPPRAAGGAAPAPAHVPAPSREVVVWRELVDTERERAKRAEDHARDAEHRAQLAEAALRELSGRIDQANIFSIGKLRRARARILRENGLPADDSRDA